jgi:hypothetical protein
MNRVKQAAEVFATSLTKLAHQLERARSAWDDSRRRVYDERYLIPLHNQAARTLEMMRRLAETIAKAHQVVQ